MAFKMRGFNPGKGTGMGNNFTTNTSKGFTASVGSGFTKSGVTPFASDINMREYEKLLKAYTSKFGHLGTGTMPQHRQTQRTTADGLIEDIPESEQAKNSFYSKFGGYSVGEEEFDQKYKDYLEMHEKLYNQTMELAASGKLPKKFQNYMDPDVKISANNTTERGYYQEKNGNDYINADGEVIASWDKDSETFKTPDGGEFTGDTANVDSEASDGGGGEIITVGEEEESELRNLFDMDGSEQESPPQDLWIGGEDPTENEEDENEIDEDEDDENEIDENEIDEDEIDEDEIDESQTPPIGSGEDDDASLDVDDKKDKFDPADTDKDGYVDKWERKDYEKLQAQQNQEEETELEDDDDDDIDGDGDGDGEQTFDPADTDKDGYVDKWERKAYEKSGGGSDNEEITVSNNEYQYKPQSSGEYIPQSQMSKNITYSPMSKFEMSMGAERNPYKYDSDNYWKWRNEKSRSHAKKVKSQYRKFL